MKGVLVQLTRVQCLKLEPLLLATQDANAKGKRGMIIAQIYPGLGEMKCVFVSEEIAIELENAMRGLKKTP